jgi:hypothetical protein
MSAADEMDWRDTRREREEKQPQDPGSNSEPGGPSAMFCLGSLGRLMERFGPGTLDPPFLPTQNSVHGLSPFGLIGKQMSPTGLAGTPDLVFSVSIFG